MPTPRRPSVPSQGSRAGSRPGGSGRGAHPTRTSSGPATGATPKVKGTAKPATKRTAKRAPGAKTSPSKTSAPKPTRPARTSRPARATRRLGGYLPETITTRTLVLSVVVLLVFVLLVPTAREYAKQTAQLGALHGELTQAQQQRDEGKTDLKRWSDPAFVKAQARARLGYVMPGDKAYRVTDPGVATAGVSPVTGEAVTPGVVPTAPDDRAPWYQEVWTSVQVAGTGVTPH